MLSRGNRVKKLEIQSPKSTSKRKKVRSSRISNSGESNCQSNKITRYLQQFDGPTEKAGNEVGRQTIQVTSEPVCKR